MSEVMNVLGDECRGDECRTIVLKGVNTKTKIYDFGGWNFGLRHMSAILCRRPSPDKASAGRQASLHSQTPQHPHISLR